LTNRYYPEIDGLRAVAVILVILYHFGYSHFTGGFVGVDVFFVISGYLITGLLVDLQRRNNAGLASFYIRRIKRLAPALLFFLLVCLALRWARPIFIFFITPDISTRQRNRCPCFIRGPWPSKSSFISSGPSASSC
jgi:peptidoglycan/LPS O-acetylase OafA/YrhL